MSDFHYPYACMICYFSLPLTLNGEGHGQRTGSKEGNSSFDPVFCPLFLSAEFATVSEAALLQETRPSQRPPSLLPCLFKSSHNESARFQSTGATQSISCGGVLEITHPPVDTTCVLLSADRRPPLPWSNNGVKKARRRIEK